MVGSLPWRVPGGWVVSVLWLLHSICELHASVAFVTRVLGY